MFKLGSLYTTRGVNDEIADNSEFSKEILNCLKRYKLKDWGDLSFEDKMLNDEAVKNQLNDRILAAYITSLGKIYIITEYNCEINKFITTIMFANEY